MKLRAETLILVVSAVLAACGGGGGVGAALGRALGITEPRLGQRVLDRRAAAILLTHPHPDHVGGLGVLHEKFPDTPIYASEATDKWMRDDPLAFYSLARQADPDYPQALTYPTETFAADAEIRVAGLTLQTAEFGPGESATATVYYEPSSRTLFSGDLTGYHVIPALIEGNSCGWLANLDALSGRFGDADIVYPGHGESGLAIYQINTQRDYLKRYRELIRPAVALDSDAGPTVTDPETQYIVGELNRAYRNYPPVASLPNLQELNVAAVGRELAKEATATMPPECN